jgi:hypothetical protein
VSARNVLEATKTIVDLSTRTLAAGQAHVDRHASGHIIRLAEEQSRRIVHAAQADLAQRACLRWVELLYDRQGDTWWNVREDGLIQLAPPWSRTRRTRYGLSEPQSRILLRIVRDLITALDHEKLRLYWYSEPNQRYALNRRHFPTQEKALEWQKTIGAITPTMWHAYSVKYPGGRL